MSNIYNTIFNKDTEAMFSKYTASQVRRGIAMVRDLPEEQRKSLTPEGLKALIEEGIVESSRRERAFLEEERIREEIEEAVKVRRENYRLARLATDLQKLGVTINPSPELLKFFKHYSCEEML